MTKTMMAVLLGSAMTAVPGWAAAQAREQTQAQPQSTASGNPNPASTESQGGEPLPNQNDIIVTAQKRAERLQDVPLTLTVVTGAALDRQTIRNITDLQNATPELNYTGQPSAGYSIRGSGTQTFTRSSENNVLVVVDGVVQGQLTPPTTSIFDIERVEVLSGPQGMLFGKNASAGVVNIVTVAPKLGEFSGRVRGIAGQHDTYTGNGVVNVPIGGTAALRLTAIHDENGYRTFNRFTGRGIDARHTNAARGRLLWEPVSRLTFNFIADYELEKGGNGAWVARIAPVTSPTSVGGRLATCGVTPGPRNTDVCLDGPTSRRIESKGGSWQIDADLGAATLTNVAAYRRYERDSDTDSDTRPINALNNNYAGDRINQWSEELRLASNGRQRVEYVAGIFLYDYRYDSLTNQSGTLGALPFVATRSTSDAIVQRSFAIFGQSTIRLTDTFNLIAGGRYTWDKLRDRFTNFVNPALGVRFNGFTQPDATATNRVDVDNFSYRVGAQYQPDRDLTLFATYARGYKGSAVNNVLPGAVTATPRIVRPEIPYNIEVGLKSALFERRINLDLSYYHTIVRNFQAQTVATNGGLTQFVFTNAERLKLDGVQLNIYARPAPGFTLNGGVLYNDARYGNFVVQCNAPYTTGCATVAGSPTINVAGRQLANAPRWKVTLGSSYETAVGGRVKGFIDGNIAYRSGAPTSATPDPNLYIKGYAFIDGRIGIKDEDNRWSVAAFVRNLTDYRAPTIIFRDPLSPTGNYMQTYAGNAFRTIGVTLEAGF